MEKSLDSCILFSDAALKIKTKWTKNMTLEEQISKTRKEIVSDGYDMSIGEVINLYRDDELVIDPEFQRYFRWEPYQKTRFIESLLLGIPIPPIFVFQTKEGTWELIDGLQRMSTVLEFAGMLKKDDGSLAEPTVLEGTKHLPALSNKKWEPTGSDSNDGIGKAQQLQIKRARIRVEILKMESDPHAKYELFQRINTGGSHLSEQEVRNCTALMINRDFHLWLTNCAENSDFLTTTRQTDASSKKQYNVELALRFFAYRCVKYNSLLDVHEYLDSALIEMATQDAINFENEKKVFEKTFSLLNDALGDDAFKRWDGTKFLGMFLLSVYEVMGSGVSKNVDAIEAMLPEERKRFIKEKAKALWENVTFQKNSGAGIRGTTRLSNLLPMAEEFFKP